MRDEADFVASERIVAQWPRRRGKIFEARLVGLAEIEREWCGD